MEKDTRTAHQTHLETLKNTQGVLRLTIGIPAYNEEENIGLLLEDIANQSTVSIKIEKVHVVSDASNDRTDHVVRSCTQLPIVLTRHRYRQGIAVGMNDIFRSAQSDAVVMLNADIRISDPHCIEKLVAPLFSGADLTSCSLSSVEPTTAVGFALESSMRVKNRIFERIRDGDNLYCCHGTARVFSKALYSRLRFPESVGEDAYSYLFAKKHGYQFSYVKDTTVWYALPQTMQDHLRQSLRYMRSTHLFDATFGKDFVRRAYAIPRSISLAEGLREIMTHPLAYLWYNCILLTACLYILLVGHEHEQAWTIASSSKSVSRKSSHNNV